VCQLEFDRIPFSIQFEYGREEGDRVRRKQGKKKPGARLRDSLDVGLLGDLLQSRGKDFTRAAPAVRFSPPSR
jgi:hypothetical protein